MADRFQFTAKAFLSRGRLGGCLGETAQLFMLISQVLVRYSQLDTAVITFPPSPISILIKQPLDSEVQGTEWRMH